MVHIQNAPRTAFPCHTDFSPVANLLNQLAPAQCHKVLRLEQEVTVAESIGSRSFEASTFYARKYPHYHDSNRVEMSISG